MPWEMVLRLLDEIQQNKLNGAGAAGCLLFPGQSELYFYCWLLCMNRRHGLGGDVCIVHRYGAWLAGIHES